MGHGNIYYVIKICSSCVTWNIQSECFISVWGSYSIVKFVYDIKSRQIIIRRNLAMFISCVDISRFFVFVRKKEREREEKSLSAK